jgi:hypothetical protein
MKKILHNVTCYALGIIGLAPYLIAYFSIRLYFTKRIHKANRGLLGFRFSRCWRMAKSVTPVPWFF